MAISATIALTPGGNAQVSQVITVADVSGSLNNTYFLLSSINTTTNAQKNFYVWFNINSAGTDPAIAGATAIPITGATNVNAATLATSINTALNALTSDFTSTRATATLTITNVNPGNATKAADGAVPTGFAITTPTAGLFANVVVNQPILAIVTVSNSGGSSVTVTNVKPSGFVTGGTVPNRPPRALGLPNFLPGQNITVAASGSVQFQYNVIFFAPSATSFGDPAGTYSIGCQVSTSDGSVTNTTADALCSVITPTGSL